MFLPNYQTDATISSGFTYWQSSKLNLRYLRMFSFFQVVICLYFLAALGRIISGVTIAYAGKHNGLLFLNHNGKYYAVAFGKDEVKEAQYEVE